MNDTLNKMSEEEYEKIISPFECKTSVYLEKVAYDYTTYFLATGFRLKALANEDLQKHINAALDDIGCLNKKVNLKHSIIKKILNLKYGLIITNETPLEIVDIKKKDQQIC